MWTGVVNLVVSLIQALVAFLSWKGQESRNLKTQLEAVVKANDARNQADDASRFVPRSDSLPDDGYRRD